MNIDQCCFTTIYREYQKGLEIPTRNRDTHATSRKYVVIQFPNKYYIFNPANPKIDSRKPKLCVLATCTRCHVFIRSGTLKSQVPESILLVTSVVWNPEIPGSGIYFAIITSVIVLILKPILCHCRQVLLPIHYHLLFLSVFCS
jgi:hypothetical protein